MDYRYSLTHLTQVSSRKDDSPLINGLPNMNGKPVERKIYGEAYHTIENQLEEDDRKNNTDACWDNKRFIKSKKDEYDDWRWDWVCHKMITENKVVLDDTDLQEFRQFTKTYLKPVKPQVKRRKN